MDGMAMVKAVVSTSPPVHHRRNRNRDDFLPHRAIVDTALIGFGPATDIVVLTAGLFI